MDWDGVNFLFHNNWVRDFDWDFDWVWDFDFFHDWNLDDLIFWNFFVVMLMDSVDWDFN